MILNKMNEHTRHEGGPSAVTISVDVEEWTKAQGNTRYIKSYLEQCKITYNMGPLALQHDDSRVCVRTTVIQ